jgi:HlyD family secretion protein
MLRYALLFALAAVTSWSISPLMFAEDARTSLPPSLAAPAEDAEDEKESADEEEADSEEAKKEEKSDEKESAAAEEEADEEKSESSEEDKASESAEKASEEKKSDAEAKPEAKADAKKDEKETKKRKTHTVKPKRLKIDVTVDGTFVAREMEEVALRPEAWSDYEIVEIVEHGQKVREGETLVKFDDEKIKEAIADLELDQRLNELAIRRDEEELPRMEKTLAMNLEEAERSDKQANEDFDRYTEIERPMMVKTANFMLKYYDFMVDYEKEELEQLEKMYEADDLTEETEEVILKRQRNSLEFAEFSRENSKLNRDETLNVRLPRFDIEIKEALERSELALERARLASNIDLKQARYELEQKKKARTKSLDRHAKLLEDRDLMEIESPADGVVYYGQCVNGRWSDTSSLMAKLRPESNVSAGTIIMTIVQPRPVYVTATFEEKQRPELEDGQKARIVPPPEGAESIDGEVEEISAVPVSSGKFEINFKVSEEELPEWIVAGMSCKVKVNTYDKKDAITVPKAAVHADEDDPDKHYVWVVEGDDKDAKAERRDVEVGKRNGDDVEIVEGLKEGDVVSLDDEKKKAEEEAAKEKE